MTGILKLFGCLSAKSFVVVIMRTLCFFAFTLAKRNSNIEFFSVPHFGVVKRFFSYHTS